MAVKLSDLKWYGSAVMPDDDVTTAIGGAIATSKKPSFTDVNGLVQVVSSAAGDTTQTVTVHYRDAAKTRLSEVKTLAGTTPVLYAATMERLLKAIKSATTAGDVAVEAQTATFTGTATGGTADTITLPAGASAVTDFYRGEIIRTTGGTGPNQIREIIKYDGATKVATVSAAFAVVPDATTTVRISKGILFDKTPVEILEVRRPFYDATANVAGGGAVDYYEKLFAKNTHATEAGTAAQVEEAADAAATVTFGLAATKGDTGTNGAGNNRKVAPAGITFASTAVAIPGGQLAAGEAIGVWLKLTRPDGAAELKAIYTPRVRVTTT